MNSLGLPRPAYNRLLSASHAAAIAAVIAVMAHTTGSRADDSGGQADTFDAPGNCNPIVPGYFADPTIKQFGDTFYLYATTDGNGGGRGPATV